VTKDGAHPEELAAITAVLLALMTARGLGPQDVGGPTKATWRRLERTLGYHVPHSWQQYTGSGAR
jgi:Acyl-CoA carboxylase epsilon subunit